ncbi:MAG: helix-turn-helix transcriptional regulator [Oscillospiraceae bacterium]|nr:helix-turn-helix transcriptional regulator [Oscillospiraceae bacterium]
MILETPYEMALSAAERFRAVRRAKKITLKEVTQRSGVPYSTIRRFESKGEISFLAFVKITSAIGEDAEITSLFTKRVPQSIEEVIRGNHQ